MSNKLNRWPVIGCVVVVGAVLSGCGGGGSSGSASLRLVNATLTHPSLDLLVNAAVAAPATAADSASASIAAAAGTDTLQLNDAGSSTALISTSATLGSGLHYTLLAYESGGAVSSGGLLLNGASVIQQGSFAATHNSTARVRLAAAVSGAATVAASAGATTLDAGSAAPSVGAYIVVPAAGVLAINVNGVAVTPPA